MASLVAYSTSGLFTFHRLAFILWSHRIGHIGHIGHMSFLESGAVVGCYQVYVFILLLNLPKTGGHEFDQ